MAEEKIAPETIEIIVEEITKEVLKRLSIEGLDIDLGFGYQCTGLGYTCGSKGKGTYTCTATDDHGCKGNFTCANIHNWVAQE
jgi:hypothetical protein